MSCGGKKREKKADGPFEDGYCSCFQQRVCVLRSCHDLEIVISTVNHTTLPSC